jgi:hypothetical protein
MMDETVTNNQDFVESFVGLKTSLRNAVPLLDRLTAIASDMRASVSGRHEMEERSHENVRSHSPFPITCPGFFLQQPKTQGFSRKRFVLKAGPIDVVLRQLRDEIRRVEAAS